jgi:hypothetical protein
MWIKAGLSVRVMGRKLLIGFCPWISVSLLESGLILATVKPDSRRDTLLHPRRFDVAIFALNDNPAALSL